MNADRRGEILRWIDSLDSPEGFKDLLRAVIDDRCEDARRYFVNETRSAKERGDRAEAAHLYQLWANHEYNWGDERRARSLFEAAERTLPESALVRFKYAHFLANFLEQPDESEEKLQEAEEIAARSNDCFPDYASPGLYRGMGEIVQGLIDRVRSRRRID